MNIKELAEQAGFNDFPNDENGVWITDGYWNEELQAFADLVRQDEREKCSEDYLADCVAAVEAARLEEREACAKFCDEQYEYYGFDQIFAAGIRARGDKHD